MKSRKVVSEKKLSANRENAKRSTGPRTDRGKNSSKFNAVRMGLFAKHIVIPTDGANGQAELDRLLTDMQREFRPEGPLEEFWVVQITECIWKFRRPNFAEKGAVNIASHWEAPRPPGRVKQVLDFLTNAQKDIDTKGTLSQKDFALVLVLLEKREREKMPSVEIDDQFLAALKAKIAEAKIVLQLEEALTEQKLDDYGLAHSLPPESTMDLIERYEKRLQKKLDSALRQLLESQERRKRPG